MKKLIIMMVMVLITKNVIADQVIFSQFNGDNFWKNMIINVTNAKLFMEPGVAFVSATDGYRQIASPAIFGVAGVEAVAAVAGSPVWIPREVSIVRGTYGASVTYNFVQASPGTNDFQIVHTIQSTGKTYVQPQIQTWSEAALNALGNGAVAHTDTAEVSIGGGRDAVDGVDEVKATKKRIASREEPQVAKAIVVVPEDANMYFFILYFFDQRITYLQLLDNYQDMHPLVPFTGNK